MPLKKMQEYMKAGHSPKMAMVKALGDMHKAKKMAAGGMVKEGNESMEDNEPRSLADLMIQGDQPPVANPEEMDEASMLASKLVKDEEDSEYMALGGLVEGDKDGMLGNKPSEDMSSMDEEPTPGMPSKKLDLSPEMMSAIMDKKKKRKMFMK